MEAKTLMPFKPKVGNMASLYLTDEECYDDFEITEVSERGRAVKLKGIKNRIPTHLLDYPLSPSINERFEYFSELAELVAVKKLKSLFVTGRGGIGKSHTIKEALAFNRLQEETDYITIKGKCTARALYNELKENYNKLVIFDDCDSILKDGDSINVLQAVLDTYARRYVKWLTSRGSSEGFEFTGSVIFLSNMSKETVNEALLTRAAVIDLSMTTDETITRMEHVLPTLDVGVAEVTMDDRLSAMALIKKYKNNIRSLNIRTLIKAVTVYHNTQSERITRYQILNS